MSQYGKSGISACRDLKRSSGEKHRIHIGERGGVVALNESGG